MNMSVYAYTPTSGMHYSAEMTYILWGKEITIIPWNFKVGAKNISGKRQALSIPSSQGLMYSGFSFFSPPRHMQK